MLDSWGYSSVGRAPALQAGGQEFESPYLHLIIQKALNYQMEKTLGRFIHKSRFPLIRGYSLNIRDEYAERTNLNADSNELSSVP